MRATPLAVFLSKVDDYKGVLAAVRTDVEFTHYNPVVTLCVFLYCSLIGELTKREPSAEAAIEAIKKVKSLYLHPEISDLEQDCAHVARVNTDTPF
mmetsp:Transcript_20908/g.32399  ORF Transcript_20908/g.32399 Transcript_20908/m.32399 type:complete len:96 (+) Transcript_20908:417-704(+)